MEKWIDITRLEKTWYDALKKVCKNVYINNAPRASAEPLPEYIVVGIGSSIENEGAYKSSSCNIYLYVRCKKSGVQDTVRIDEMVNEVLSLFPMSNGLFSAISPRVGYGTRDGEFTLCVIRCKLVIKQ